MNKYFLHILLMLIVSVGCSRNDEYTDYKTEGGDIQFNIVIPDVADTRGASIINSREQMDGMSVGLFAFMTSSDTPNTNELRAENVKLTYNKAANSWEYTDLAEPLKWNFKHTYDKFSFYVYYPYDENATDVNFDMDNETFSVDYDAVVNNDVDVMIAELEDIVCPKDGVITIDLKHILSAIRLNTDYTKIKDVKFCSNSTYTSLMPMSGTASISNGTVQWENLKNYSVDYSYLLGNTSGNYALIIPQTISNKGDLYFSMLCSDGTVDNDAQIPAQMKFEAGQIYTFKYKGSYAEYDEETNTLVVDIDEFYKLQNPNDYSSIDKIIEQIVDKGATLKVVGTLKTTPYILMMHIIEMAHGVANIDFSELILGAKQLPFDLFDNEKVKTTLKSIQLPVMDDSDFSNNLLDGCTALETVEFAEGSTLTSLKGMLFTGCKSLKSVNLEVLDKLTDIGQMVFEGCTSLKSVEFPKSLKSIGQQAFKNCTALEEISLHENLSSIGMYSFYGCEALTKVKLSQAVNPTTTTIGMYAFANCDLLSEINIPSTVMSINNFAFNNCVKLYSYDHDDKKAGFVVEPRDNYSTLKLGSSAFYSTYVQSTIDGNQWWGGSMANSGQFFSTPL